MGFVVMLSVCMAIHEVDRRALGEASGPWAMYINYACFGVFVLEVTLSLYASGLAFFADRVSMFNLAILATDVWLEIFNMYMDGDAFAPYVRLLRTLRMGRFFRILLFSRECYMLAYGLGSTMKATLWAAGFLMLTLTGFSTIAVEVIHPLNIALFRDGVYGDCARCEVAFSSVMESNLTFFQTIIAGDSWGTLAVPIVENHPWTALIFLMVFVTINFGLLNLILAVIVDRACEARAEDELRCIAEKQKKELRTQKPVFGVCARPWTLMKVVTSRLMKSIVDTTKLTISEIPSHSWTCRGAT